MLFSSPIFLFQFLPLVLVCYTLSPRKYRNLVALVASLWFYAWGAPRFIFVLLLSSYADFALAPGLHPGQGQDNSKNSEKKRRYQLIAGLSLNLSLLLYFKYANFFIEQCLPLLSRFGFNLSWSGVALPIGISFFTFQKISYLVDVYRGTTRPADKFSNYFLYVALFPQLIAGPIIRYHDVARQILSREHSSKRMLSGIWRFCLGLAKKMLLANPLGEIADQAFNLKTGIPGPWLAWLGLLCYTFQIYYDFSGYSDMAIGLGRMLGFEYLENFNAPYIARNFTEFWRRWHISLTNWMREYLYIPLGGNRYGWRRTLCNLWLVFLLSGLWHGASWNFILWGALHGTFLSFDKLKARLTIPALPGMVSIPLTFTCLMLTWVFFRAEDLPQAFLYLKALFHLTPSLAVTEGAFPLDSFHLVTLAIAAFFSFIPLFLPKNIYQTLEQMENKHPVTSGIQFCSALLLLFMATCSMVASDFNPFIYFRF